MIEVSFPKNITMEVGKVEDYPSSEAIESEPMMRSADFEFVERCGGTLTKDIVKFLISHPDSLAVIEDQMKLGRKPKIDTKSVMLMPGMYPCIGGWHCDDVPRDESTGQPDLEAIVSGHKHFLVHLASNPELGCHTQFLRSGLRIPVDPGNVWASVDEELRKVEQYHTIDEIAHGSIVMFDRHSLHRGTAAKGKGWRYFFRMSFTDRDVKPTIRKQVQVYTDINAGW